MMDKNIRPKPGYIHPSLPLLPFQANILPLDASEDIEGEMEPSYEIREQDRLLPLANVARVMNDILPPEGKLSKGSKMCMQECASEFISFVTSEAIDRCQAERRKTLNGEDILYSMYNLGFENYAEALKIYLTKYRESERLLADVRREKDRQKRKKRKEKKEKKKQEQEQSRVTETLEASIRYRDSDSDPPEMDVQDLEVTMGLRSQELDDFVLEAQEAAHFMVGPPPTDRFQKHFGL